MYFFVVFNGIHYPNEVNLQNALDYIQYRAKREHKAGKTWTAFLVSAENGEIVFETNG